MFKSAISILLIVLITSGLSQLNKGCIYVIRDSQIDHVKCSKLNSLTELSALMQITWRDVIIENRPGFPFQVAGKFLVFALNDLSFHSPKEHESNNLNIIERLDLSKAGHLSMSDHGFKEFTSMRELNVSGTRLNALKQSWFISRSPLEVLDISHNYLNKVFRNSFINLSNLKHLNVSHNDIETVEVNAFADIAFLKSLDLSFNNIKELSLGECARLKSINLGDNLINVVCLSSINLLLSISKYIFTDTPIRFQRNAISGENILNFQSIDRYIRACF